MTILEALLLGIIQGFTEFLPISSSGHIELGTAFLGIRTKDNLLFTVVVHAATAMSTIVVFKNDIWQIFRDLLKFERNESLDFVINIFVSMVPVAIIGLLFEKEIGDFFGGQVGLVGFMLLVTGLLLSLTYYARGEGGKVTLPKALLIGIAQAIAILPGISRSGATISTALLLKVDREKAARFSFLMVLIPILGGSFLKLLDYLNDPVAAHEISGTALLAGFIAAFIAGLVACKWMIALIKKGKLIYFAIYCFIVGTIAILTLF